MPKQTEWQNDEKDRRTARENAPIAPLCGKMAVWSSISASVLNYALAAPAIGIAAGARRGVRRLIASKVVTVMSG